VFHFFAGARKSGGQNYRIMKTALCIILTTLGAKAAVSLNQLETFSTLNGWTSGGPNPNPPAILADSGPLGAGDSALLITANGGGGAGGKLIAFNQSTWTGDYLAEGIVSIAASLRNSGSTLLSIRLAFNGDGGWFVTDVSPVTAFSGWSNFLFDIRPASLINAGGSNASTTMANVTEMRILHSAVVSSNGAQISSSLLVDNLHAIPEPGCTALLTLSGLLRFVRKR
jgi:hypothetical protein